MVSCSGGSDSIPVKHPTVIPIYNEFNKSFKLVLYTRVLSSSLYALFMGFHSVVWLSCFTPDYSSTSQPRMVYFLTIIASYSVADCSPGGSLGDLLFGILLRACQWKGVSGSQISGMYIDGVCVF